MTAKAQPQKEDMELQKVQTPPEQKAVTFAAPEEMFERFANLTRDIGHRAYDFFRDRGGRFGFELEDWFKAENELLRPVPVEITQTDDKIFVKAAVAGFKPEEIEVSVKDNILVINGISMASAENNNGDTFLREWNSNRFCRQLILPSNVTPDDVTAKLENGMLMIAMRKEPFREAQKIPVTPT